MTQRLIHRGPDGEGFWLDEQRPVFLGHRRLAILDREGGHQPMSTSDGNLVVVFNGEIYNAPTLRTELEAAGHVFLTDHSDTEVLLHGYRQWGESLPEHLNGMWAFAIYDRRQKSVFCSRDRFGKKPFYYCCDREKFVFASELTSLFRHSGVDVPLSRTGLIKYFAYGFIPAPHSLYEGVFKLRGGESLVYHVDAGTIRVWPYWTFSIEPDPSFTERSEQDCLDELEHLLDAAVERRLVSDVPLGLFLSGGVDSSIITALAARRHRRALKTFSIGFEEASFDEANYARQVAAHLGVSHDVETLSIARAVELIGPVLGELDEPLGDSSLIPTYLLCRAARRHVTVALGGDGADELFAGYAPFRALRWARLYQRLIPKTLHQAILLLAENFPVSHGYMSLDFKIKRTLRGLSYPGRLWNTVWMSPLSERELSELFNEPLDLEDVFDEAIACWEDCRTGSLVDRTLQFFTRMYMQDDILTKVDRASMMNSLEVRSPFLDIEVVDFVRRLPTAWKLRGGTTKYLLKKLAERWLPKELVHRSKQGFAVPIGKWLYDGRIGVEAPSSGTGLSPQFVRKALDEHRSGHKDQRLFLWSQLVLSSHRGGVATRAEAAGGRVRSSAAAQVQ